MKKRTKTALLGTALGAALLVCGTALLAGKPAAPVRESVQEESPTEERVPVKALADGEGYLLRETEDGIAVYLDGKLLRQTDIYPPLLRRIDRRALQQGIRVENEEELLKLIEDFDS